MNDVTLIAVSTAAPHRAREVVIPGKDGVALGGTLVRPPKVPAMLLVQGSGPVDRDGNIPGVFETDLQKQIAEAFARAGIASLRYDKRIACIAEARLPKDEDALADFLKWDNFVGDAAAAWRFLREQPGIDRQRVGIFGHSEGGVIALAAARHLLDAGEMPAALVLAATPGRPMSAILRDQIERIMQQMKLKPDKAASVLQIVDRIHRAIAETGKVPGDVPRVLKRLYRPESGQFLHVALRLDPAELAAQFPGPVLIIEGTADKQVSARDDALALDAALSGRPSDDHELLIVPRVSHALRSIDGANARHGKAGPVEPALVKSITAWAKAKLAETWPAPAGNLCCYR